MSKLKLPDVTLVMIDTDCIELAYHAVKDSMDQVEFGEVLNFCPSPIPVPGSRWIEISKFPDMDAFNHFLWYKLPDHIATKYMILIQWDSWILDATQWTDEFLEYDYVGAPWCYEEGEYNVGNGCALRSLKLMRYLKDNNFVVNHPEDDLICRGYRKILEDQGFKWPSEQLAARFSFESSRPSPTSKHFMFHALRNFPLVLEGERLDRRLKLVYENLYIQNSGKLMELEFRCRPWYVPRLGS